MKYFAIWTIVLAVIVAPLFVGACTPSQLSAVQTADDALLAALPVACAFATDVDPAGGAVICGILTASGDLVSVVTKQFTPAVAQAIVSAHPATVGQGVKLMAASKAGAK